MLLNGGVSPSWLVDKEWVLEEERYDPSNSQISLFFLYITLLKVS